MGDEPQAPVIPEITPELYRDIVDVLRTVYGGGYINNKMTFEERQQLRAKSYRSLKRLGLEK